LKADGITFTSFPKVSTTEFWKNYAEDLPDIGTGISGKKALKGKSNYETEQTELYEKLK
jgi:hypothetical protein